MSTVTDTIAAVSFRDTPLDEISPLAAKLKDLGWEAEDRGPDWVVKVRKRHEGDAPAGWSQELREAFGDRWVDL